MSPCHPFRPVPGQCGPHRRGPLPAPPFDPRDYWATKNFVSSLFGSLETRLDSLDELYKVDVVDPGAATEVGQAADAKKTQEKLNGILAKLAKKADSATTLAGYGITDAATKAELADKADLVGGKVPAAQLPSFVDDVLEYDTVSAFPAAGEDGKIYIDKETNKTYRWSGTQYVEISQSLALGETASTAYPGDKGKVVDEIAKSAFDAATRAEDEIAGHKASQSNPHAVTAAQIGAYTRAETDAKLDAKRDKTDLSVYTVTEYDYSAFEEVREGNYGVEIISNHGEHFRFQVYDLDTFDTFGVSVETFSSMEEASEWFNAHKPFVVIGSSLVPDGTVVGPRLEVSGNLATSSQLSAKADLVDGKVPAAQLPSFVDDVLEYDAMSSFPATGENSKIYVAKDTNLVYRWSGTQYVEISPSPTLDDAVTETSSNGVKSSGIWSWVKSLLPKWLTSDYAEPATVESVAAKADKATTLAGYGITDAVPFVKDLEGFKTAVNIGTRVGTAGPYSLSNGELAHAIGKASHAEGIDTIAFAPYSYAGGVMVQTLEEHPFSYVWNGDETMPVPYDSHGKGTFNINPVGGLAGFYLGEQTLPQVINAAITGKADLASIAPEYSATSAYSVGAIVCHDGSIYQCKTAIADGGEAWNAEHWELRKLDDFFTESNSLLTGTIDARLPYPLNAVTDETGLLKDRAINTTSLASVTVPDNFTDLLIRASVASSLAVTMPDAIATKYGDTFPGEAGEYLITITKTGAAESYVRTIKL